MALQEAVSPVHAACLCKVYITLLYNSEVSGSNYHPLMIILVTVTALKRMSRKIDHVLYDVVFCTLQS
jgi:cytochrome c oxidase assembly factor CtaG